MSDPVTTTMVPPTDPSTVPPTVPATVSLTEPSAPTTTTTTKKKFSIRSLTSKVTLILGILIRSIELGLAILVLGLTANTANYFGGSGSNIWLLIVAIASFIYLVSIVSLSFWAPGYLNPGMIVIAEGLMFLFYFTAFIAEAADFGSLNCDWAVNGFWNVSSFSSGCKTAKAAAAFGAINFLLFVITFIVVLFNVILPLSDSSQSSVWEFAKVSGVKFDKTVLNFTAAGLARSDSHHDEETKVGDDETANK